MFPALGAVTCNFTKEVRPFTRLKIWTRVLSWDSKWIYLISHFVEDTNTKSRRGGVGGQPVVYAWSISKQVIKLGRQTITPEDFFSACGLLSDGASPIVRSAAQPAVLSAHVSPHIPQSGLDNQMMQEQMQRGLALANKVAALDDGLACFKTPDEIPFAQY